MSGSAIGESNPRLIVDSLSAAHYPGTEGHIPANYLRQLGLILGYAIVDLVAPPESGIDPPCW